MTINDRYKFGDLYSENSRNGTYKSKEHHGRGVKIVNMGELFGHEFISTQPMKRLAMSDSEMDRFGLQGGDLLFGRRSLVEAGAGKCSLVTNIVEPTTFESSIIRVRLKKDLVDPKFMYYYFKAGQGRGRVFAIVTGTNVKGIRGSELAKINVDIPGILLQKKIADILSAYDDLIENNRRRIVLLEESARLLYREWFVHLRYPGHETTKIFDGVPEGWSHKSLIEVCDLEMGQSPKSEYYNSEGQGLPFHQGVSNYGFRFVRNEVFSAKTTKLALPGDILFSVRAPVGRINLTRNKMVLGRGLSALRSKTGAQSFLFYLLKEAFYKENLIGSGAIFNATNKKELSNFKVIWPNNSTLEKFDSFATRVDLQIDNLDKQVEKLIEARDLLLPRLMDGRLEVAA